MLLFSGVSPYAKTTITLNHIHAHHTPHSHVLLFFVPSAEEQKMRSRNVLKSLCRRASSSSSSTKHTRCVSCGGKKKKTTPTNNTHRMQYMLVCLFPCSLFPWFGSIRFVPHACRDDCEALECPEKKIEGKENNKKQRKIRWKKNKEKRSSRGQRSFGPWISSSSVCQKKIKNLLPSNIATWPNESS